MVIRKEKKPKTEFSIVVLRASSPYEIIESLYIIILRIVIAVTLLHLDGEKNPKPVAYI